MRHFAFAALAAALASTTIACGDVDLPPTGELTQPACVALDRALAAGSDAWRAGLMPLDDAPRPSVARPGATIRLWVSPDAIEAYRGLAVDAPVTGPDFPRGGLVVREMFDETGAPTAITATCRAQDGYNPGVEDLWFATRKVGPAPAFDSGALPSCGGCHQLNSGTQGLYGPILPE